MGKDVKIALIQMSCSDDIEGNYKKALGYIRQAAGQGAQIICTQELFKSRYFCQMEDNRLFGLAERIDTDSPTIQELSGLASSLNVVIIASLFEKRAPGLYHNATTVVDADGGYLGKYRKMHIPDDPRYYEKFYFTPGDLGYRVFRTKYADIGVLICWDQWFPEASRLTAMKGAEIILIPTAIGFSRPEVADEGRDYLNAWQIVQRGHAVANACYLAAVNRVGFEATPGGEGGINFWGSSFVADPYGKILAQGSEERDEIVTASIDLSFGEQAKDNYSFPFRDRRIDSYGGLTKLYSDT
jgi:N-carbamoylputrescine amidase